MINLARLIIARIERMTGLPIKRVVKFGMVGSSGIIVDMGLFYIFNEFIQLHYRISSIISIELAIINNFTWNTLWTWKDCKTDDLKEKKVRFFKYHLITGFSAIINYGILVLLVEALGMNKYLAKLAGILASLSINFVLNHKWTFKKC